MTHLIWSDSLNTGIDVIDRQHMQIVDYINKLHDSRSTNDRSAVSAVIDAMIDYTISHFGFEEALMEDAGYEFLRPHKKVHELFIKKVEELHIRFNNGEEIVDDLHNLLTRWLFNHIKHDDAAYLPSVSPKMHHYIQDTEPTGWLARSLRRFFGTS